MADTSIEWTGIRAKLTAPNQIKIAVTNAQYDWLYRNAPIFRGEKNIAAAVRQLIDKARKATT